ncbi:MAG: DNA repair protein RecO [Gammaproteobacteria bacterium]|nr:DNA repair protein RecO [Gammaproteobacteria bacterium]
MTPQQPAYILHSRPYRDSSLILELLIPESGRIACVARGARKINQRRQQALQPFMPLLVTLRGRSSLKTLTAVESAGAASWLQGRAVYAGLYANELLIRVLAEGEAQLKVFADYQTLLQNLTLLPGQCNLELEAPLRCFELKLLTALGICPQLDICAQTGQPLIEDASYRLVTERGFIPVLRAAQQQLHTGEFTATELLALAQILQGKPFPTDDQRLLATAKRLNRTLLAPLLGTTPLRSRELFGQLYRH